MLPQARFARSCFLQLYSQLHIRPPPMDVPTSLFHLPDEVLWQIISLVWEEPPLSCELGPETIQRSVCSILHINGRLRSLAFEYFSQSHAVLNLCRVLPERITADSNHPLNEFLQEISRHFELIPHFWRTTCFHQPRTVSLRLWSDPDIHLPSRGICESAFICKAHGLTFLLQLYQDSAYETLRLNYTFSDQLSPQLQLFLDTFELCESSPVASSTEVEEPAFRAAKTCQEGQLLLRLLPQGTVGRDLVENDDSKYLQKLLQIITILRSCIEANDFESANWILLHFGEPLVKRLSKFIPPSDSSLSVAQRLARPEWSTDKPLARLLQGVRAATSILYCINLAYCTLAEPHSKPRSWWGCSHVSLENQIDHIDAFGLLATDIGDLDFVQALQWAYEVAACHGGYWNRTFTEEHLERGANRLLALLKARYRYSDRSPLYATAYQKLASQFSSEWVPLEQWTDDPDDPDSIDFVDIDGVPRVWSGPSSNWEALQRPLHHDPNTSLIKFRFRAQELCYRGESYQDLKMAFLQNFCRTI